MDSEIRSRSSKRNSKACEHCRAARIRCQASEQPGVCERCLALKRECISRTRPRPRRWERSWGVLDSGPSPPSTGLPATFTINYTTSVKVDFNDKFETLFEMHDRALDAVLGEENLVDSPQSGSQLASLPTPPPNSTSKSQQAPDIWRQPLFDLASAESLLRTFKSMVSYLPFIVLPDDSPISYLATTKPFTLLSILTVASGSTMVQKHALYDDEFRKALSLKYVFSGEKSLELLQGVLIYCSWYPFHLRPKNGQLVRCLRIAADLIRDLHLDEDFVATLADSSSLRVTDDKLDKIRAYLAYLYLVSTYIVAWRGERDLPTHRPAWASTAIDTLEYNAQVDGDYTLVTLVRLSHLFSDASKTINEGDVRTVQNSRLVLIGLEQQNRELQQNVDRLLVGLGAVRMQAMFIDVFLDCGGLLAFPVAKTYLSAKTACSPPPLAKMYTATTKIRIFLDYVSTLEDSSLLLFTINDWTRLIAVLTLSFRLSFPISTCPEFDSSYARSELQLDQFLLKMSHGADVATSNDLLSASRAMLSLAKSKYDRRLESLGRLPSTPKASRTFGCPVMDGGLRATMGQWDFNSTTLPGWAFASESNSLPLFHDPWATMTMGWGNQSDDIVGYN